MCLTFATHRARTGRGWPARAQAAAARVAAVEGWTGSVRDDGALVLPPLGKDDTARLVRRLVESGVGVHAVTAVRGDLEEVFLETIDGGGA